MNDLPKAPKHLSREAKAWWREIVAEYTIDDVEGRFLLQSAMESFDLMRKAEKEIAEDGMKLVDRYGQIRTHPACIVARDARNQMLNAISKLKLDDSDDYPKRPGHPTKSALIARMKARNGS